VAVDTDDEKLAAAREAGAHHVVNADEDPAAVVRDLTGGLGAELVLDFVGADTTMANAAAMARAMGRVAVVGLAGGRLPVGYGVLPFDCSLEIPYWGTRPELFEVIALAQQGLIRPQVEQFPLDRASEAYQRLREGAVRGRAVVVPEAA
jgi:propanol-preferring alcohol dehydrogenase